MKILAATFLLLFSNAVQGMAQVSEDDEPILSPKILALDTTLSVANRFNDEIGKLAEGYSFAFTDKSRPKTIVEVYKTKNNETLRLEYKYTTDGGDSEDINGKPVISFQRIIGDAAMITKIYNHLFNASNDPSQINAFSTLGTEIMYRGQMHQLILEPDDYYPGYWAMTFVR